jgi:hypothetical protein
MRIRLTRKFALTLNGVDLSKIAVGEEIDLPERSANILIAEGWAEPLQRQTDRPSLGSPLPTLASD